VDPCDPQRASDEAAGQKTPGPAGCASVEDPPGIFSFVAPEPKCDATKCILSHGLISKHEGVLTIRKRIGGCFCAS